jgi:hypothetical protein
MIPQSFIGRQIAGRVTKSSFALQSKGDYIHLP